MAGGLGRRQRYLRRGQAPVRLALKTQPDSWRGKVLKGGRDGRASVRRCLVGAGRASAFLDDESRERGVHAPKGESNAFFELGLPQHGRLLLFEMQQGDGHPAQRAEQDGETGGKGEPAVPRTIHRSGGCGKDISFATHSEEHLG